MSFDPEHAQREPENARAREGDVWAGPYTVANEPTADGQVQVVNSLGQPFCVVARSEGDPDWSQATSKARHIADLLNAQQPYTIFAGSIFAGHIAAEFGGDASAARSDAPRWASLPTLEGRKGPRAITRAQFDALVSGSPDVAALEKSVARFLTYPGVLVSVTGHSLDFVVLSAGIVDGKFILEVEPRGHPGEGAIRVPLDNVVPAGPVSDAVRVLVKEAMHTIIGDLVRDRIKTVGERPQGVENCSACDATGQCGTCGGMGWVHPLEEGALKPFGLDFPEPPSVHHVAVHSSYDMKGGSCEPSEGSKAVSLAPDDLPLDGQ